MCHQNSGSFSAAGSDLRFCWPDPIRLCQWIKCLGNDRPNERTSEPTKSSPNPMEPIPGNCESMPMIIVTTIPTNDDQDWPPRAPRRRRSGTLLSNFYFSGHHHPPTSHTRGLDILTVPLQYAFIAVNCESPRRDVIFNLSQLTSERDANELWKCT